MFNKAVKCDKHAAIMEPGQLVSNPVALCGTGYGTDVPAPLACRASHSCFTNVRHKARKSVFFATGFSSVASS